MSFWHQPPNRSDVAIIGAGLTGISIALQLAEKGIDCCVFERGTIASGASGRNDGQIITDTADFYPRMKAVYGAETAFKLLRFKRLGIEGLHQSLLPFLEDMQLAYHQVGSFNLAYNDAEARQLEETVRDMAADGFAVQLVDRAFISDKLKTDRFPVGKFDPSDATVNPAALTKLLAALVRKKGVPIVENCAVEQVESGRIVHTHGVHECEMTVVATNAYAAQLLPGFEEMVFPIRGQVLATKPSNNRIAPYGCITNFGYDYWHWTGDGRLILGGRRFIDEHGEVGYDDIINDRVHQALDDLMLELYPQCRDLEVDHRWSGIMGFSKDGMPLIGPIDGDPTLWCAVGFTGYGLGMGWAVGEAVAATLNGDRTELSEILPIFTPSRLRAG